MPKVIVIEFVSLDGVMQDPDGSGGSEHGGWAFRYGPEAVAGDKFGLGETLTTGALLLGRQTWQLFSHIWPNRTDEFSAKMNAIDKLVATRTLDSADDWENSTLLADDLIKEVTRRKAIQDIIVIGSLSVVRALMEHDLIDQYRLLVFPIVLGGGERLFDEKSGVVDLQLAAIEPKGAAVLLTYNRTAPSQ
jgi:dihydrofolate reductase